MKPNKNIKEWQKHAVLVEYAKRFGPRVFIETGTFRGDTIKAMLPYFRRLFTIDTNEVYATRARQRFSAHPVEPLCGDSAILLPEILKNIQEPCLFWLDAHHVGTKHHNYEVSAPILAELDCILSHSHAAEHVLLIDDVWFFRSGHAQIPSIEQIESVIRAKFPNWAFEIDLDIMRSHRC